MMIHHDCDDDPMHHDCDDDQMHDLLLKHSCFCYRDNINIVCVQLVPNFKLKVKQEKEQIFLSEIIPLQENGARNVIVYLLTEEAPSLKPPPQTNAGF